MADPALAVELGWGGHPGRAFAQAAQGDAGGVEVREAGLERNVVHRQRIYHVRRLGIEAKGGEQLLATAAPPGQHQERIVVERFGQHIQHGRRVFAVALPFLDAMLPALRAQAKAAPRFTAIYCGNGANMLDWTPATEGVGFELSPSLKPIEAFRNRLLVVTGLDNYQATDQGDVGGQHPRAAPAFMSCAHPKQTEGADVEAGITIDQLIAEKICRDTKLPSLEVSVDRNDVVGACDHGYACAYMNSMSWKTPTTPLPSETNPRFVFERMFGVGQTAEERLARVKEDRSILDGLTQEISHLSRKLGATDRNKLGQYFDAVRDVEQRIMRAESTNSNFEVPEQPVGVPETFKEYIELMFDLQVLAFQADITRVTSLMMARENVNRAYPEIGLPEAHHSISHHGNNPEKMKNYTKLNTYHVETLGYFLTKLDSIKDTEGTLLDIRPRCSSAAA